MKPTVNCNCCGDITDNPFVIHLQSGDSCICRKCQRYMQDHWTDIIVDSLGPVLYPDDAGYVDDRK